MSGLVISSSEQSDLQLFIDLANRIGLKIKSLSTEEMKKFDFLSLATEKKTKISKNEFLNDVRDALSEVKDMQDGKLEKRTLRDSIYAE